MSTNVLTESGVSQFPALTSTDRSCAHASGAVQALIRVQSDATGLDFLLDKHSFDKHEAALIAQKFTVVQDVREAVLNPPKSAFDTSDH